MRFTHHPRHPLYGGPFVFDPNREYPQHVRRNKPQGLWLSVDDDWARWCTEQSFAVETLDYEVEFRVDLDRVLVLDSVEAIDRFDATYVVANAERYLDRFGERRVLRPIIDWAPLATEYAGIMIAPFQWERHLWGDASGWYSGWDCASACVWNLDAISMVSVDGLTTRLRLGLRVGGHLGLVGR